MARRFEAIVIGSGLGGLTAGALCARAGMRVLVLERNENFGGAATVYRHNGLAIEASLHEIDGLDDEDPKSGLIHSLGLDRDLQFIDVGDLYEVRGGPLGAPFVLPHGFEKALGAAIARFPQHRSGLEEYFKRLAALRGAVSFAARHRFDRAWWLTHALQAAGKLWPLYRYGRATVGEVGNAEQANINWGKAGRMRWKGKRPSVRGVVMNPVDHPHGGGEGKTSGGRHPVSPWGKPEGRTRKRKKPSDKLIVRRRRTGKKHGR